MIVSGLTKYWDWRLGNGKADYIDKNNAIAQNIATRIKSFTKDWFLDVDANIDWIVLLGHKNMQQQINRALERVILETVGVIRIEKLEIENINSLRDATIRIEVLTIYGNIVKLSELLKDIKGLINEK